MFHFIFLCVSVILLITHYPSCLSSNFIFFLLLSCHDNNNKALQKKLTSSVTYTHGSSKILSLVEWNENGWRESSFSSSSLSSTVQTWRDISFNKAYKTRLDGKVLLLLWWWWCVRDDLNPSQSLPTYSTIRTNSSSFSSTLQLVCLKLWEGYKQEANM